MSDDCLRNIEDLIISARAKFSEKKQPLTRVTDSDSEEEVEEAGPSGGSGVKQRVKQMELPQFDRRELNAEEKTKQMIREAEKAKANIFTNQGKVNVLNSPVEGLHNFEFTAKMDEDYMVIGAHIDEMTQEKIVKGEYIDFGKLFPRDRILVEEDQCMELVMKNGHAFWTPASSGEMTQITNLSKWEQAFQIYSNIYTRAHPERASELIQYNHIISTIALSYVWDNVYAYDKEFHIHLSKHTKRSWAIILQQAWTMQLKDRLKYDHGFNQGGSNHNHNNRGGHGFPTPGRNNAEPCRRFNRGKCNFGSACKYDHRCTYCGKFGHGFFVCRWASADKDRGNNRQALQTTTPSRNTSPPPKYGVEEVTKNKN